MANLSITTAWNETAAFVAREAQLVLPVGFLLLALPGAVLQMLMPTPVPGELPQAGAWLAAVPVAIVISLIGTIAITLLALRPGTSVGEALQHGARRLIPIFLAILLLALGAMLLMVPVMMLFGGLAVAAGNPAIAALAALAVLPAALFLWVRFALMTPIAAAEPIGPIAIIQRSWALSRGHFWKLLGFLVLLVIAAMVISIAVGALVGIVVFLIAGTPTPGSVGSYLMLIVSALVQAVVSTVFAVMIARVYAQLAGTGTSDVFA